MEIKKCKLTIGDNSAKTYEAYQAGTKFFSVHKVAAEFINEYIWYWTYDIVNDCFKLTYASATDAHKSIAVVSRCKRIMYKGDVLHVYELPLQAFDAACVHFAIPKRGRPPKATGLSKKNKRHLIVNDEECDV